MYQLPILNHDPVSLLNKPKLQVLQLAPKEGTPELCLLLERRETIVRDDDNNVIEAQLSFHYQEMYPARSEPLGGEFCGSYVANLGDLGPHVSLTSRSLTAGAVYIDPAAWRGRHLGTYLMDSIVDAMRRWPTAHVNTIHLLEGQADGENKLRRNRFYEQFNIQFAYHDDECEVGESLPMLVRDLCRSNAWNGHVKEMPLVQHLKERENERRMNAHRQREDTFRIEALTRDQAAFTTHPFLRAAKLTWWRLGDRLPALFIIVFTGIALYYSLT